VLSNKIIYSCINIFQINALKKKFKLVDKEIIIVIFVKKKKKFKLVDKEIIIVIFVKKKNKG